MRKSPTILAPLLMIAVTACGGGEERPAASATPAAAPPAVSVRAQLSAPDPGTVTVAWTFDLADGWHLYASLLNDSGYPPSVALTLPDGWRAGPLRWPVPERYLMPGDILDHVYHHRLVLLQDLVPPDGVRPEAATVLGARLRWLACRQECVPGQAELSVTIPGRDQALPAAVADLPPFPQPLPPGLVTARRSGATVSLEVAGARGLRFFPDRDSGPFTDLAADGEAAGGLLELRLREVDGRLGPVRGLLQVEQADGTRLTGPFAIDDPDTNHPGG